MPNHRIAVIAGDGVGQEVIPEAKRVLAALEAKHGFTLDYTDYDWGSDYYLHHGLMAPAAFLPDIATESLLVDAAAMNFIRRPESFDVVVASNLFGDILSDISAMIVGSMGLAASANLDPSRRNPSMFEPVHGSAPDIAFKGIVNPLATFLCAGQMLEHLDYPAAAADLESAIRTLLAETEIRTPDLGGTSSTAEVTDGVIARVQQGDYTPRAGG